MAGELITLPLRLSVRVARTAMRSSYDVVSFAVGLAKGRASSSPAPEQRSSSAPSSTTTSERSDERERETGDEREHEDTPAADSEAAAASSRAPPGNGGAPPLAPDRRPAPPEPDPEADAAAALEQRTEAASVDSAPEPEPAPGHVSEEATLVESLAEPGAEDGAGAQLRIDEPWEGYGQLNARQVISRLRDASPEELAAIELFERANKSRETVLTAVERKLRT